MDSYEHYVYIYIDVEKAASIQHLPTTVRVVQLVHRGEGGDIT